VSDLLAQTGPGGFTTRMQRTVEWGDCDPAGIIFYPTYYRWMDAASWHLFSQAGYNASRMRAEHLSLPLVHTECSFVRSPTFGETLHRRVLRGAAGRQVVHGAASFSGWRRRARTGQRP
jgi:4-hydroxybenzoyl-CoA thioesterase